MKRPYVALFLMLGGVVHAEGHLDATGKKVTLPLVALSFADEVVSFTPGKPAASARDTPPCCSKRWTSSPRTPTRRS